MRLRLPAWTPLLLVVLLAAAWPLASLASGAGPQPEWVHSAEGDPVMNGDPVNAAAGETAAELAQVGVTSVGLETAPWRGTERSSDNPASTSSGSKIKLVYAYAADQPDRFSQYANLIQTDAKAIAETVAATSGGAKTLRFDTGTDGGAGYVDIVSVRLPQSLAYYKSLDAGTRSDQVRQGAAAAARVNGTTHYAVYADGFYGGDWVAGIAQMYVDERKNASNYNNRDGLWAFVWGDGSANFSTSHRTTLLHEITHTLGGVQRNAPNGTNNGHCSDVQDVMCYDDGGMKAGQTLVARCTTVQYDCNGEDYFNANPAPGSYLASNWNVFDSSFLCSPSTCVSGGPVNIAPEPAIDESGPTITQPAPPASSGATPANPPTSGRSGSTKKATKSSADRAVAALLAAGRSALRRGVPARLSLPFSAPQKGRLSVSLSVGPRRAASVRKSLRTGRSTVVLKVDGRARRSYAKGAKASLSVSFAPSSGRGASARAAVSGRR